VAAVAIDGSANAAILTAQIMALSDEALSERLILYKQELEMSVDLRNERLIEKLSTIGE
jgi:5-(carboxyamino)imidazole ribonucleotide mutase